MPLTQETLKPQTLNSPRPVNPHAWARPRCRQRNAASSPVTDGRAHSEPAYRWGGAGVGGVGLVFPTRGSSEHIDLFKPPCTRIVRPWRTTFGVDGSPAHIMTEDGAGRNTKPCLQQASVHPSGCVALVQNPLLPNPNPTPETPKALNPKPP